MYIARARCESQLAVRSSGLNTCWSWGRAVEFKFLVWSSIAQSVFQQAFGLLANRCLRPWVRILHSAEENNLSPFDSNIVCLCQSIEINNNKHVYITHIFQLQPWTKVISMIKVKVRVQKLKSLGSKQILPQLGRFRALTAVWIHKWLRNDA